ncbi:DUF2190 family protein [Ruegeria atlantica]|uniref:DUF2190 family protein n=1 Tax=Ruegeria atlantica TaxID=81569 RepID=UPI0014812C5D|nr:DUF2190 family protein [Ruegeria atlantica]
MMNYLLTRNYKASGAIPARRLVRTGPNEGEVRLATAGTQRPLGASADVDVADGAPCDVHLVGTALVEAHGAINAGDSVTAAAEGRAQTGTTANHYSAGIALSSATARNDVIEVLLAPDRI